ncbi:uncharacterized protein LOC115881196 [Sitophilus oryzae]|uniref:Uncharacterized protein LOC115881196 n=1 Tax=Sitophilus oryzae TaxID=7048 RepID=A0A6J2XV43_SITOR|nr:uncharacterized protein LOC115881196 [Sitophilus oryzae]
MDKYVRNVVAYSDRIILLQLSARPMNINILQIYAPTADKAEAEALEFYEQIREILHSLKPEDINVVLGDFNSIVGSGSVEGVTGAFGLGDRNERGEMLVQFCLEEDLVIKKTFYKLHPRKLYLEALRQPGVQENLKIELDKLCQENDPSQEITANNIWSKLKRNTIAATETVIGRQKKVKSKPWMTDEILTLMADRRIVKNQQDKYNEINRSIKRKILEAKEKWIQEKCEEAERLHQLHDSFNFHRKIKEITGENKRNTLTSIKNRQGTTILDIKELNDTWKNYAEALFWDQCTHNPANNFGNMEGPKILESEVRYSIDCLKNGKSPGHVDIYAEVLKQTDIKQLTYLFNVIYDSGQIPQDWLSPRLSPSQRKQIPKTAETIDS